MFKRFISTHAKPVARMKGSGNTVTPKPKKPSRQERIALANLRIHNKLYHLDAQFKIFNRDTNRVLDLGYVPGNWLEYARDRLCAIHGVEDVKLHDKAYLLGFDLLFGTPPLGTTSIQGNILSQASHDSITNHFKDYALRGRLKDTDVKQDFKNSYYVKEQSDLAIENQINEIEEKFSALQLEEKGLDYKPQLILSDLSAPFLQDRGFFNNTQTKPYLRLANNSTLNQPIVNRTKASFDLADACIVLCCDLLRKNGSLLLRLQEVHKEDAEYEVLMRRLDRMFETVTPYTFDVDYEAPAAEVFFVCEKKKKDFADKTTIFAK